MRTFRIYTLGCKVNQYDTQNIRERFIQAGFKELEDSQPANIYVINTCTVTHRADTKSFSLIQRARRENPQAKIIVTGCLTELDEDEIKKIDRASLIFKNKDKDRILETPDGQNSQLITHNSQLITFFKGHTRAFLKIQDGCNNFCSYCKVPRVRGVSRSKPLDEIIQEANRLVRNGFKELVLCGICLGSYGKDLLNTNSHESKAEFSRISNENYSCRFDKNSCKFVPKRVFQHSVDLTDAIEALEKIEGLLRIRVSSIEAGDISDKLINKIVQSKKICRHLHIPIQSGDDDILKEMHRNYCREGYLNLIKKIKSSIPGIAITTDVLVGFPGEKDDNFQNTLDLIREIMPLRVHIFPYSKRSGTPAGILKAQVNPIVIKERISKLRNISKTCALDYKKKFLNQNRDVLIEGHSKENKQYWEGYTDNYIKVWVKSGKNFKNQLIQTRLKKINKDYVEAVL